MAWNSAPLTSSHAGPWPTLPLREEDLSHTPAFVLQATRYKTETEVKLIIQVTRQVVAAWGPEPSSFHSQSRASLLYYTNSRKEWPVRESCWCWWSHFGSLSDCIMGPLNSLWSHCPLVFHFPLHLISSRWCAGRCLTTGSLDVGRRKGSPLLSGLLISMVWILLAWPAWTCPPDVTEYGTGKRWHTTSSHELAEVDSSILLTQLSSDPEVPRPQARRAAVAPARLPGVGTWLGVRKRNIISLLFS